MLFQVGYFVVPKYLKTRSPHTLRELPLIGMYGIILLPVFKYLYLTLSKSSKLADRKPIAFLLPYLERVDLFSYLGDKDFQDTCKVDF